MKCKKCGWLFACKDCDKLFAKMDEDLDRQIKNEKYTKMHNI